MKLMVMGVLSAALPVIGAEANARRLERMLKEERVYEGVAEIKAVVCAKEAGCRIYLSKKPEQLSEQFLPPLREFAKRHDYEFGFRIRVKPGTDGTSVAVLSISG